MFGQETKTPGAVFVFQTSVPGITVSKCKLYFKSSLELLPKGKAVPSQAWSGPEGSSKLRFPDFMAIAQDGGKVVSLTHRPPLSPGNASAAYFC